jgi:hypothetical protein
MGALFFRPSFVARSRPWRDRAESGAARGVLAAHVPGRHQVFALVYTLVVARAWLQIPHDHGATGWWSRSL